MQSLIWWTGKTPASTRPALEHFLVEGKTNPGQSHTFTKSSSSLPFFTFISQVCKCRVLPGMFATLTTFYPHNTFITEDLPTLGQPTVPIYILYYSFPFSFLLSSWKLHNSLNSYSLFNISQSFICTVCTFSSSFAIFLSNKSTFYYCYYSSILSSSFNKSSKSSFSFSCFLISYSFYIF